MRIAIFTDDFDKIYEKEPRKVVVWGAGQGFRERWQELSHIDVVCDLNAKKIGEVNGFRVVDLDTVLKLKEKIYIIVAAKDNRVFRTICDTIQENELDAVVFHLFNNIAWGTNYIQTQKSYLAVPCDRKLRVNIVNREGAWIFKKFADKMEKHLKELDVEVFVSSDVRYDVDINHHIPFAAYTPCNNDTLMVTHVDKVKTLEILKKQLRTAAMGVCMSKDTMNKLVAYGVPRDKLCYINPAQDNAMPIHKYTIGITNRCYDKVDVRKRASALLDVLEGVNPAFFCFVIMGSGWDDIITGMRENGFDVKYYPEFDYATYMEIMSQIDYYLFMGFDEGAMGYLDALAAGVGTIVTPQGYHLDVDCGIDYPCSTVKQFREAFLDLQSQKEKKIKAVSDWTWENYALKHLEIWNYLLKRKPLQELYKNQLCYEDGIYSAYIEDNRI